MGAMQSIRLVRQVTPCCHVSREDTLEVVLRRLVLYKNHGCYSIDLYLCGSSRAFDRMGHLILLLSSICMYFNKYCSSRSTFFNMQSPLVAFRALVTACILLPSMM